MAAKFFGYFKKIKRFFGKIIAAASAVLIAATLFFAGQTKTAEEVILNKRFYFLAAAGENTQSCVAAANSAGGAGVEVKIDNRVYVVFACYIGENGRELAEAAQSEIGARTVYVASGVMQSGAMQGVESEIVAQTRRALYLKTAAEKRRKDEITGVLNTLDECANVLFNAAKAAESGEASQSALKETAKNTAAVFSCLAKFTGRADKATKRCAAACGKLSEELQKIASEIVFARDLRRVQIGACLAYLDFSGAYSI